MLLLNHQARLIPGFNSLLMNNITDNTLSPTDLREDYIQQLADEFKSDPNCFPALWIAGECVTASEEQLFYKLISK